jgi:hypothetical protein
MNRLSVLPLSVLSRASRADSRRAHLQLALRLVRLPPLVYIISPRKASKKIYYSVVLPLANVHPSAVAVASQHQPLVCARSSRWPSPPSSLIWSTRLPTCRPQSLPSFSSLPSPSSAPSPSSSPSMPSRQWVRPPPAVPSTSNSHIR